MTDFVTCDLLDDNANKTISVVSPYVDNKRFISFGGNKSFSGQVVTIKCFEDNSRVKELLATAGDGKVLVVDGGGSMRCALLGDMIAQSAVDNGWAGVIVYGCVRDVDAMATMPLGVMALGSIPKKSVRKGIGDTGTDIHFGDVTFCQDDWLYADNNGIIVAKEALL